MLLLIHPFSSSFFFLSNFQILNIFVALFSGTVRPSSWNLLHTWTMGGCIVYTRIRLLLLICFFISSFFFLSNFQTLKILSHFSQELWDLESWNFVHTWKMGGCIMYTAIKLCCCLFIPIFIFLSNFQRLQFFFILFLGTVRPKYWKLVTHVDYERMYHLYCCCWLFIPLFLHLSFSPVFKHLNFS